MDHNGQPPASMAIVTGHRILCLHRGPMVSLHAPSTSGGRNDKGANSITVDLETSIGISHECKGIFKEITVEKLYLREQFL